MHYINGPRKGKDAHRIEKEAMYDPFLADALTGYESVKDNHIEAVSRLRKMVRNRTKKKNYAVVWWAAASVALILGFALFLMYPKQENTFVSQNISKQEQKSDQNKTSESGEIFSRKENPDRMNAEPEEVQSDQKIQFSSPKIRMADTKVISADDVSTEKTTGTNDESEILASSSSEKSVEKTSSAGSAKRRETTDYGAAASSDEIKSVKPDPVMGMSAYQEYLKANATQPTDTACATAKGKVKVSFYVSASGRPFNIRVEKPLCPSCDQKAVDLIRTGGDWTPGNEIVKLDIEFTGEQQFRILEQLYYKR
ncbi:MAG: hypothetical protein FWF54_00505 [Candidatus Azobacteroides sp.]|nr:hypothetical protein [Candidatus Azobacteroides sp.]